MKTRIIFNPFSGRNRRRPWFAGAIRDYIRTNVADSELVITEGSGHATVLAREAADAGYRTVVAVGGDGTMNEVAQALIDTPTVLALVPCGSGNGLALHLGLPRSWPGALGLISATDSRVAVVDTGSVNGLPFFNAMGTGLDANVSRRFNGLVRRGLPAYARIAWSVLRQLHPERVAISEGSWRETYDTFLVTAANSDQYGNNARIAPGARVDDGLLDLVAVEPVGLAGAAILACRLFLGTFIESPRVHHWRAARFVVDRMEPGTVHTDGETHEASARLEIAVQPASLRVLVPAASTARVSVESSQSRFALRIP